MRLCSLLLLAAAWPCAVSAQTTPAELRDTVAKNMLFSLVIEQPAQHTVTVVGTIDAKMGGMFKQALAAYPQIDTVRIDSYGGNIEVAMDMAGLIRQRKMRMVVDGRCLSACANYLFPAAAKKTVLPGSVVAIHGLSLSYLEGTVSKQVSKSQAQDLFRTSAHSRDKETFDRLMAREARFYRELKLGLGHQETFARYLAHRRQVLGTDVIEAKQRAPGCPPYQMWALDKAQWEAAGVSGIEQFWYPATTEQREQLLRDLGMPAEFFYYGGAAGLESLCTQALPLRLRLARWLASVKSAFAP